MTFMTMINDYTGDGNDDNDGDFDSDKTDKDDAGVNEIVKRTKTLLITKTLMSTFPASFPAASVTGLEVERHR